MTLKTIRAPDMRTNLGRPVPEQVHAVAQWALPPIRQNYAKQQAEIAKKLLEAADLARAAETRVREHGLGQRVWTTVAGAGAAAVVLFLGLLLYPQTLEFGSVSASLAAILIWAVGGLVVVAGVGLTFARIAKQIDDKTKQVADRLAGQEEQLRDVSGHLDPDAVMRVGRVYWAFELVRHPNGQFIPVNLAATPGAENVPLLCPDESSAVEAVELASLSGLQQALAALESDQADLAGWQGHEGGLCLSTLPARGESARELAQELSGLFKALSVTPAPAGWPLIGRDGVIALLDKSAPLYTAGWQRCLVSGGDWIQTLVSAQAHASRSAAHGVAAVQEWMGRREASAAADGAVLADWMALQQRQPDVSSLSEELRARRSALEQRLEGGIESKEQEKLLEELRKTLLEIHQKPWLNIVAPIQELKRTHATVVSELSNVAAQMGGLSAQEGELDRGLQTYVSTERTLRELVSRVGQLEKDLSNLRRDAQSLHESARGLQASLDKRVPRRLNDTPLDPRRASRDLERLQSQTKRAVEDIARATRAGQTTEWSAELSNTLGVVSSQAQDLLSLLREYERHWEQMAQEVKQTHGSLDVEIREWRKFQSQIVNYGKEEEKALGALYDLEAELRKLRDVMETLKQQLGRYHTGVLQIVRSVRELVGGSDAAVRRLDAHQDERERAVEKSRQDADRLQDEYRRRVDREKARVGQEIQRLQARQERLEWVVREPTSLVDELTGCSVHRVARLRAVPRGLQVQDAVAGQVECAIASARAEIEAECERRMAAIRTAQVAADGALQIQPGNCREADLLLVPLWYVEWRRTLGPAKPARKRYCYRLATPLELVFEDGTCVQGELYPALTRYLRELTGLGEWEGEFPMGREPAGKLAARVRQHACLEPHEIEALVQGMSEAVAQQAYPQRYAEMVEKSRDDLAEWRVRAPLSGVRRGGERDPRHGAALQRLAAKGRE